VWDSGGLRRQSEERKRRDEMGMLLRGGMLRESKPDGNFPQSSFQHLDGDHPRDGGRRA
jgi:hypothetical protein